MLFRARTVLFVLLALVVLLPGCGGGTAGTGTRTIEGQVRSVDDQPIAGATITALNSGESTTTDANGNFVLETEQTTGDVPLQVEAGAVDATVTVESALDDDSSIHVDITVDPVNNTVVIENVQLKAKIVGTCDVYFENTAVIRQANRIPDTGNGITCTAKVQLYGDGQLLQNTPFEIQTRRCKFGSPWAHVAGGKTRAGADAGIGQVQFRFHDDAIHCVYRIIAPQPANGSSQAEVRIDTLTKQAFDGEAQAESKK